MHLAHARAKPLNLPGTVPSSSTYPLHCTQRDLDEALPALDAAVASLKNLSRNDVVEVKAMQNPPQGEAGEGLGFVQCGEGLGTMQ